MTTATATAPATRKRAAKTVVPVNLWGERVPVDVGGENGVHRLTCQRCAVRYPETHYHCCVCHRVFRGASNFERHQKAFACYTDAALLARGMVCVDGVWRGMPMDDEAKQRVRRTA